MEHTFFATLSRMKYIERWSLMRNARTENLSEHAAEVAMIAHVLCVIGNIRYGKHLDADRAALIGLYHDASEIITGDMPTPVKYFNHRLNAAYKEVESKAADSLLEKLPDDLRDTYHDIFYGSDDPDEVYIRGLVKAADKISALVKCVEEENAGNREFTRASASTRKKIEDMKEQYPEINDFMQEFFPPYGKTLDELI